jgi:hypothetical protein
MIKSFNGKALGAFKNLGAVALITAITLTLAMFFVACKQTSGGGNTGGGGGGGTPTSEHAVTFSVEGENGSIKAKVDDVEITSGAKVKKDKVVKFVATTASGYKVKEWKVDGVVVVANTSTVYTHTVTKAVSVKVSFELVPVAKVVLTLDPAKKDINVTVSTADGSEIKVEGCTEQTLASGDETTLNATGEKVTLIGKIIRIDCSKNQLTGLDLHECTSLQRLNCSINQLSSLNVKGLTALQDVNCCVNALPELDVQGLTALQELYCNKNQIKTLNMHGCVALKMLNCGGNQLKNVDVQGLNALETIWCYENELSTLNLQGLTYLQDLDCHDNQFSALSVQGLPALTKLTCYKNELPELVVQGLATLKELDCANNKLTGLNVSGCTALKKLDCTGNQIKVEAMTELLKALPTCTDAKAALYTEKTGVVEGNCKVFTTSESLKAAFNEAKGKNWKLQKEEAGGNWVDILLAYVVNFSVKGGNGKLIAKVDGGAETEVSPIAVEEGKEVTFKAKANDGYRVKGWTLDVSPILEAGRSPEYRLTVSKATTVNVEFELMPEEKAILTLDPSMKTIEINVQSADNSNIVVEGCNKQTIKSNVPVTLTATGTEITLKGKITYLRCSNRKLTALNVQNCASLVELDCWDNQLSELDVQYLIALQRLNCSINQLTALNVKGCVALKELDCHKNKLNAKAMTDLLKTLPARVAADDAKAALYTEQKLDNDDNCKDFGTPESLKVAFDEAKGKNWKLLKFNGKGRKVEI